MDCSTKVALITAAGLISGILLGFLFRNSDAEADQAFRSGYRNWLLRAIYSPIYRPRGLLLFIAAIGLMFLVLWAPSAALGIFPLCGDDFRLHKIALAAGVFLGWFLRWLLWRFYLHAL